MGNGMLSNFFVIWLSPARSQIQDSLDDANLLEQKLTGYGWSGSKILNGTVSSLDNALAQVPNCGKLLVYVDDITQLIQNDPTKPAVSDGQNTYLLSNISNRIQGKYAQANIFILGPGSGLAIDNVTQLIDGDVDHPVLLVTTMDENHQIDEFNLPGKIDEDCDFYAAALDERDRLYLVQTVRIKYCGNRIP